MRAVAQLATNCAEDAAKAAEGAKAPSSSEFKALFLEKVLATKRVRVEGKALWLERKA